MTLLRIVIIGLILVSEIKLDAQTESSRSKIEQMLAMPGGELASYILEKAYGIPFEKLLEEKLFKEANMSSSAINLTNAQTAFYANGYGRSKDPTPPMKTILWGGSGHAKSTITDLINYSIAILFHFKK